MDFNVKTNEVSKKKTAYKEAVEQAIDCDITLPEYFPDIVRVLKCTLTACISNVQKSGDRVTAEGMGHLSLLYVSDENCIRCFEQDIPFTRFCENKAIENSECSVRAKTEYVNCRAVSGRRIDIHGCLSVNFCCYAKECCKMVCGCEGGGVETRRRKINSCNMNDCCERGFSLNETYEIGAGKPSIVQLVRSEAAAVIEDVKTVSGKMLIKGELTVKTLYIAENIDDELQIIEHTMPISQIIEANGAEDNTVNIINMIVSSLSVSAKTDTAGALRLLDVSVELRALSEIYQNVEIETVTDAYSTKYEINSKSKPVEIRNMCDRFTDTYLCRSPLDLSGTDIEHVIDMSTAGITFNSSYSGGELKLNGTITVNILTRSKSGEINFTERQFDFEYKRSVNASSDSIECNPNITITGSDYILSGDDKIDARVQIDISAAVFEITTVTAVTDIEICEDRQKTAAGAALTIYFAESGERVWDIAQRYNTTVNAIMAENALGDEILPEKCKLLIPRA